MPLTANPHRILTVARLLPALLPCDRKEHHMLDLVLLALGLVFFALSIGYAYACDRL
jgi:SNF family Na+-dependent transporter